MRYSCHNPRSVESTNICLIISGLGNTLSKINVKRLRNPFSDEKRNTGAQKGREPPVILFLNILFSRTWSLFLSIRWWASAGS